MFCLAPVPLRGGAGQITNIMAAAGMHNASPGAEALPHGVGRRLGGELLEPDGAVEDLGLDPNGGDGAVKQAPLSFLGRSRAPHPPQKPHLEMVCVPDAVLCTVPQNVRAFGMCEGAVVRPPGAGGRSAALQGAQAARGDGSAEQGEAVLRRRFLLSNSAKVNLVSSKRGDRKLIPWVCDTDRLTFREKQHQSTRQKQLDSPIAQIKGGNVFGSVGKPRFVPCGDPHPGTNLGKSTEQFFSVWKAPG